MPSKEYRLVIVRSARKEMVALPPKISVQVQRAIDRLVFTINSGQRPQDIKPLKGEDNAYRIDTGEYRVAFELDDKARLVIVYRVRHRKDVYRNL